MIEKIGNIFHLSGKNISYIIEKTKNGLLMHSYFGKKIRVNENYHFGIPEENASWQPHNNSYEIFERYGREYNSYGYPDLHMPAFEVENKDGNTISHLVFKSFKVYDGAYEIKGMPCLFSGDKKAGTLELVSEDKLTGLEITLIYTVFEEYNIIARSVKYKNLSDDELLINRAYSLDFCVGGGKYDVIYFSGAPRRERDLKRISIEEGTFLELANARGGSGHEINPFVMFSERKADEDSGDVYSMSLIYSGNHSTVINCDYYGNTRIMQGINPFGFEWKLEPGAEFETPQSILCFSDCGFGGISRELSDVFRNNLMRSKWANKERPVLINNWEGTGTNFDEEKLIRMAEIAKSVGIELFVLDDGWFGKRNDDTTSLGDWYPNREKLPSGIDGLAKKINEIGMDFGLWFEPEMISPESELYKKHPDWAIHIDGRETVQRRNQYILDFSKDEVCEYITEAVTKVLSNANIMYVKWDMNRPMTNMPYAGYNHKYILGLYKVLKTITERFPDILFEGCACGGGRFDAGILAYMPQIWASDNSDAIKRLQIQYATSMGYPNSSIAAHVTATPNHQNGRETSLKTRYDVACMGAFGYELDITKLSDEELEEIKEQVEHIKKIRKSMLNCDFYRVGNPFNGNYCTWQIVSKDKKEFFVMHCKVLAEDCSVIEYPVKLKGLKSEFDYKDTQTGEIYGGDMLMSKGYTFIFDDRRDFSTLLKHFRA